MNRLPTFPKRPKTTWSVLNLINATRVGTGSNVNVLVAAETNDIKINTITIYPKGANTVASVFRLFINNGRDFDNPENNILYEEFTVPASTASNTAILPNTVNISNLRLPAGYRLLGTISRFLEKGINVIIHYAEY